MSGRFLTATEILAMALPSMPADKGSLSRLIEREGWRSSPLARESDRGWEYAPTLLPAEAQAEFFAREAIVEQGVQTVAWEVFERLPDTVKAEAERRLGIVDQVEALRTAMSANAAVTLVAKRSSVATSTLWNWLTLVAGVAKPHRLPALAPHHRGRTATAECDPRAWAFITADYLRPERPSFAACYRRLTETAALTGWSPIPIAKTLKRRLERELPAGARALARDGRDAAARMFPHQTRDRSVFKAMQAVNADGHRFDVFCRFEDGTIDRPVMIGVQDVGTGMIVGHRVARTENWTAVRLAFADMVERHGIPEHCYFDNGKAFASKWLSGGMKTRFTFTIKDDEPTGILTQLGIQLHWTTPYHGQSKPIERAWRDLAEEVSKHPMCAGAYTGNSPEAKPENYSSRAVPIAEFRTLVANEIARHNTRTGRRGPGLNGRSFADAFAASIAAPGTIVTRATAAQRRLLLLAAQGVTCKRPTGEIALDGNRYWHEALTAYIGRKVIVRFDPENLHTAVGVYARDGRLICEATPIDTTGFDNSSAAQANGRTKRAWLRNQRERLNLERTLGIEGVAALIPRIEVPAPQANPGVVRLAPQPLAASDGADAQPESFGRAVRALAGDDDNVVPFDPDAGARERRSG